MSEGGLLKQLTKRLVERALNEEIDDYLDKANMAEVIQIITLIATQRSN